MDVPLSITGSAGADIGDTVGGGGGFDFGPGGVISGAGKILGGYEANAAGQYNAQLDEVNARLALGEAQVNEMRNREESYRALSSIRAGYGASGVAMEGSPSDVLEASARDAELDAQLIRFGGKVRANAYRASAALSSKEGKNALAGGVLGGIGDIVSSIL